MTSAKANCISCGGTGFIKELSKSDQLFKCACTNPKDTSGIVVEVDDIVMRSVHEELFHAMMNWPPMNSAHEGFAVLMEETDELWQHVKTNQKKRNLTAMKKEAIQVAAMACRFAIDVCDEERGRR